MNVYTKRRIRPRFIVIILALVLPLGAYINDQQAQGGTAGAYTAAIQKGDGGNEVYGQISAGPGTSNERTGSLQGRSSDGISTLRSAGENELSEHGNNAKVKEKSSPALPVSRDDGGPANRGMGRLTDSLFSTIGQNFTVTAYTAGYESTGKHPGDKGYGITYSGKKVAAGRTIAADLDILPLGTKVLIEGLDYVYTVEDKGGAVTGNHIDLYIPQLKAAQDWGVQYRRIIVLEMGAG